MATKTVSAFEKQFLISRTVDAPLKTVWKCWTELERLKKWFGPKGSEVLQGSLDFRPGGLYHYCMRFNGQDMWGKFEYHDIVKEERIIWVNSFSDADAGVTRHPFGPTWPIRMLTILTMTENAGKTTIDIKWSPIHPTPEESDTFAKGFASMNGGWGGTFEGLEAYLKTL